jgi:riboflavin synthase
MFTGLIKTQGTIRRVDQRGDCMVTIAMAEPFAVDIGDSISCNGICLTAVKVNDNEFKVSLSAETMNRTTARDWAVGSVINLEPSLSVGDAMGGHFVSGHVDGLARIVAAEKSGDSTIWEFEVPPHLARFIAPKGSVTLDGVSLTVNEVRDRAMNCSSPLAGEATRLSERSELSRSGEGAMTRGSINVTAPSPNPLPQGERASLSTTFTANIIPHTAKVTNFGRLKVGESVNLEIDMLARYVARLTEKKMA